MGGTFDPVHNGHVEMARHALTKLELEGVLFMPAGSPPHKQNKQISAAEHRVNMVRLAIEDEPRFVLDDLEVRREGLTYTQDTLLELKRTSPAAEFYFLIGADTLFLLYTWKNIADVARLTRFAVAGRPTVPPETLFAAAQRMREDFSCRLTDLGYVGPEYSSQSIRQAVEEHRPISGMVAPAVEEYIKKNGLYRN